MDVDRVARRVAVGAVIACLIMLSGTVGAMRSPGLRKALGLSKPLPAAYPVGGAIDVPSAIYESTDQTLVVFARSACGGCQRAKPALARIVAALESDQSVRVVVIAGPRAPDRERDFVRELGLPASRLVSIRLTDLKVRQVPTVVLVDRLGRVRETWEGAPADADAFADTVIDRVSRHD